MNDGIVCDSFARPIMEKIIEVQEEKQNQNRESHEAQMTLLKLQTDVLIRNTSEIRDKTIQASESESLQPNQTILNWQKYPEVEPEENISYIVSIGDLQWVKGIFMQGHWLDKDLQVIPTVWMFAEVKLPEVTE